MSARALDALSRIEAVLLDMDGTIVDSHAAVERAWTVWAGEYGVGAREAIAIAHGSPAEVTIRRLLPGLDPQAVAASAARQLELQYDDLSDVAALPGTTELLEVLGRRRLAWAVVTSADRRLARVRLEAAGIAPPALVTVEDVTAGKPDPECYLRAAEVLGVAPDRCLVVEDAEPGVISGKAAGMAVAALSGLDGDIQLSDLGQLARFLDR